jgi:hypothetical protein
MLLGRLGSVACLGSLLFGCHWLFPYSPADSRSELTDMPQVKDGRDAGPLDKTTSDVTRDKLPDKGKPPDKGKSHDTAWPHDKGKSPDTPGPSDVVIVISPDACPVCVSPKVQCCPCYACFPSGTNCATIRCPI